MNHPNIVFEARRLARAPGWYVRVAWPDGRHDHVPGFVTEDEAREPRRYRDCDRFWRHGRRITVCHD